MASLEALLRNFNPRPEPDILGRRDATPLEIIKAMNGEFNFPKEKVVFIKGKKSKRRFR